MKRFKDILCVLENHKVSRLVLERAVMLAENNQANLTVVQVIPRITAGIGMPDGGPISTELQERMKADHIKELESLIQPYQKRFAIQARVLQGTPFLEIIYEVIHKGHDLVIKTPETWDWLDQIFSSEDMHLLRKCPCPVWLIKPGAPEAYDRILAAVDVDDNCTPDEFESKQVLNRQILEMSVSLAVSDFAELHVVHVWDVAGEGAIRGSFLRISEEDIRDYVEQARQHHATALDTLVQEVIGGLGVDLQECLNLNTHLVRGWARKEIPALTRSIGADLVVMGTVGRTGIPGVIMGNTAETILNQIDCSVLAIKPPGFVTPVKLIK